MVVITKLAKMIQFYKQRVITVKCSPSQRLLKFILFKIIICKF